MVDSVPWQFSRVGGRQNKITLKTCIYDLDDDVAVSETDDEAVFWGVIFVFRLCHKAFTGVIVGFALSSPAVLDLKSGEVRVRLEFLDEGHLEGVEGVGQTTMTMPENEDRTDSRSGNIT